MNQLEPTINISLEEWRLIAKRMGYSNNWASMQFGEYYPMSEVS